MRRMIRQSLLVGAAVTAMITLAASPASAGTNSGVSYALADTHTNCADGGKGNFYNVGDWFNIEDDCIDGHSAVLEVDVAPYEPNNGYDKTFYASGGSGTNGDTQWNLPEGTNVTVRACLGESGTIFNCGNWKSGNA